MIQDARLDELLTKANKAHASAIARGWWYGPLDGVHSPTTHIQESDQNFFAALDPKTILALVEEIKMLREILVEREGHRAYRLIEQKEREREAKRV